MRNDFWLTRWVMAISFSSFLVLMCSVLFVHHAEAAVSDWHKGISIYPHAPDDYSSDAFKQTVRNIQATGANYITLIVPIYQSNVSSSDIHAGGDTPTDASLTNGINYIHSLGMHVMLKIHDESQDGQNWRAYINASDRDSWYAAYGGYLNHLGDIGKQTGLEGITMGAEMISMAAYTQNADNTERWQKMIADLRTHFPGFLTYDANWSWAGPQSQQFEDEVFHIGFWSSLDYVGISAYYPLATNQTAPSVDSMVGSWAYWDTNQISIIHNNYQKPLLFTEVGYRSVTGAHDSPCCTAPGPYDGTEQANDYEALFEYWNNSSYMVGVDFWDWDVDPNYGGTGNTDYTANNKPALAVVTKWFSGSGTPSTGTGGTTGGTTGGGTTGGTGGASTPPAPSSVSGSFTATANSSSMSSGQPGSINVTVNSTGQASHVIADVEVYDSANNKIFQQFFADQSISQSQPETYSVTWTPSTNGTYTVKTGIFASDWSKNYYWNDSLYTLNIGNSGSTGTSGSNTGGTEGSTNTGPAVVDIWWPSDGSTVQGLQPFKALVENKATTEYTMYWQVDGGQLNQMADNPTDAPHKEALVNLEGWTWKGQGPYVITFIAKDTSGNVIAQKSANITIMQ